MPTPDPQLVKKMEKLKKEISELKVDVRFLKSILIQVDSAQSDEKDHEELKKIEQNIDDLGKE